MLNLNSLIKRALFSFVLLVWASVTAFAGEPVFGPELTFSNRALWNASTDPDDTDSPVIRRAFEGFYEKTLANCEKYKDCVVTPFLDRYGNPAYKVTYTNGWSHSITLDPSVIEIPTRPATIEEFEKFLPTLKRDIFSIAAELNIVSGHPVYNGSCHINIGLDSFNQDPLLFRNFIVDLANHPELARGVLENDTYNSPTIEDLGLSQKRRFKKVIERFDRGELKTEIELSQAIIQEVYTSNPGRNRPPEKYQAINLTSMNENIPVNQRRVEFRGVRSLATPEELLKVMKMFRERIRYLGTVKEPLSVEVNTKSKVFRFWKKKDRVGAFKNYIEESGLDWNEYNSLMMKPLRTCDQILRGDQKI